MPTKIDVSNKFLVSANGNKIVLLSPPHGLISYDDALLLAAYLVAMSDGMGTHTFDEVVQAVTSK